MKRAGAIIIVWAALLFAGCANTDTPKAPSAHPSSGDVALHQRSVQFEQQYEQRWHVSKDTADCVMVFAKANINQAAIARGLRQNPRHTIGNVNCESN